MRHWLILGPLPGSFAQDAFAAAAIQPAPGAVQQAQGGEKSTWIPSDSYSDVVDVCGAIGASQYRGSGAAQEAFYAFAIIVRDTEGDAMLSIGADPAIRVWINGKPVLDRTAHPGFSFDQERTPIHLTAGKNNILIKLGHKSGPCRFAARILAPNAAVAPHDEIAPAIRASDSDNLAVRTDYEPRTNAARVHVEVTAAGGRIIAHSDAARGEVVNFATRGWTDGAYEVHCTTATARGSSVTIHLPWYKGNAVVEARRLIEAARAAPAGPTGATLRMLADLVLDRLGGKLENAPDDTWPVIHSALLEFEELEQLESGGPGPIHPGGFVRLAYIDETDGSTQFGRAYLPAHYDPKRRWPVVIYLHGYNPPNPPYIRWWSVDQRHNEIAEKHDVIFLEPHARGNSQYMGIGDGDVLRCLDEAKSRLSVDDDRVYLTGESMGGSGTWILASRHPDVFAAIAPVFGGWDHAPGGPVFENPSATSPPELFAKEIQSSFVGVEGLLNVPIFVNHGDHDQSVSVDFSRRIVRTLQRWGYDIRYEEHPGMGHEDLDFRGEIVDWLLTHRRITAPRRVRLRAPDLASAGAYWVHVISWQEPLRVMSVDAEVVEPGYIRLDTENVARIALSAPPEFRGSGESISVVWNGIQRRVSISHDGMAVLSDSDSPLVKAAKLALADSFYLEGGAKGLAQAKARYQDQAAPMSKTPGQEGRLSEFFRTPFAIVVGTASPDPDMKRLCRMKADALASLWTSWQHTSPRVFRDSEITAADQSRYSLVLIGGVDANLITRQIASKIPLAVANDSVTIDGRRFAATDAVAQMIYPSPLRPERYVLVVASTSTAGMYFWNPSAFWNQTFGFPTAYTDWTICDGRRVALAPGLGPERSWVASGVFNQNWRRDDRWVFPGDAELRTRSPLRHAALPGPHVPSEVLDSCTGRYLLAPGYFAVVSRDGGRLKIQFPGEPPVDIVAESDTDFAIVSSNTSIVLNKDAQGKVIGLILNSDGRETKISKVN